MTEYHAVAEIGMYSTEVKIDIFKSSNSNLLLKGRLPLLLSTQIDNLFWSVLLFSAF